MQPRKVSCRNGTMLEVYLSVLQQRNVVNLQTVVCGILHQSKYTVCE